jgi:hypothetical protein
MHYLGLTEEELMIQTHERKFRPRRRMAAHAFRSRDSNFYTVDLAAENSTWKRFSVQ